MCKWTAWTLVIVGMTLGGCAVGPDYKNPEIQVPSTWNELDPGDAATQSGKPITRPTGSPCDLTSWWTQLGDPTLDSLISRAIQSNLDLRIATARVREVRAQRSSSASELWPQIGLSGSYRYSGSSLNTGSNSSSDTSLLKSARDTALNSAVQSLTAGEAIDVGQIASNTAKQTFNNFVNNRLADTDTASHRGQNLFQTGFDATWELDVFGGTRRGVEAADADLAASIEDRRNVMVSLVSEVAREYVQLRGYQRRLIIAFKNIEAQRETVAITRDRLSAGFTNELEVAQAKTQLSSTTAQIPVLQDQIRQTIYRLSILLGLTPGSLVAELEEAEPIPANPPEIPIGLPSDLLRRRPDVRSAERNLAAATARIGEAIAELFPKFSLTGSFGTQSRDIRHIFDTNSITWGVGPSISLPIFQGGQIRASIEAQNARQEQALATYEQTVLTALGEVETALSAYSNEQTRHHALSEAVETSQQAAELSRQLYVRGMTAFLNVLDAQRTLYSSEEALVESDTAIITNLIALYKALGGGWDK